MSACVSALMLLAVSCSKPYEPETEDPYGVIEVGAAASGIRLSTRANTPGAETGHTEYAEKVDWLIQPLKRGLDITYGKVGDKSSEKVAILKLLGGTLDDKTYSSNPNSGYAVYSFQYRDEDGSESGEKAKWRGNGPHYFEGVLVPNRIRFTGNATEIENDREINGESVAAVSKLTTDQSGDTDTGTDDNLGNYTLLSHYLGMPANTDIPATTSRILLPFRHRLAHVIAYIVIEPELNTRIKGYNYTVVDGKGADDPASTSIRFCNVDVLKGVNDKYDESTKMHTLTPQWAEKVRKVIPHFYGQIDSLLIYENDAEERIFGSDERFNSIHETYSSAYRSAYAGAIAAGKLPDKAEEEASAAGMKASGYSQHLDINVPAYDLIVRPTYSSYDDVMYDEEGYADDTERRKLADRTNKIDFLIELENGLTYEKEFVFDLNANSETSVYLTISHEGVNFDTSESDTWDEYVKSDDYYGVDNKNGNNLSKSGSSWQRAFTCVDTPLAGDKVTDGNYYDGTTEGGDGSGGQYLTAEAWTGRFAGAYRGGPHHGDYFILDKDITIDARDLPDDFVFTGHLNGFHEGNYHKIRLTGTGMPWKEYVETDDYSLDELYVDRPEGKTDDEAAAFILPEHLYTRTYHEEQLYTAADTVIIGGISYDKASLDKDENGEYKLFGDGNEGHDRTVAAGDVKTPAYDEYTEVWPTRQEVMTDGVTYYTAEDRSALYTRPAVLYRKIQHMSATSLFAGLDGIYTTRQESEEAIYGQGWKWEANVHRENNLWIPYREVGEGTANNGWRAEVMNLSITGGSLFSDGATITGNVQNCNDDNGKVDDHIPAMPKYK